MAARIGQLQTGRFPAKSAEFSPALPGGIPADPFTSQPLRWVPASNARPYLLYSLGPDRQDQLATIEYDATNGTISPGDVTLQVRSQPEFPFKHEPLHARTPADVYRAFPNGLPADPFADTRGRGLGVSNTIPVRIYSFGADTNQHDLDLCDPLKYQVQAPAVYLNTAPRITECYGSPPQYIPNIIYDPTNGVVSRGDLYINVPQ